MLDLKRLRVLGEVARQGSFSAAADALYLSQSAVSQQVATLEKEVGMPLLERTAAGPKLTDAGASWSPTPRRSSPARGGRARAQGDRRPRGGRAADRELPERQRHAAHRGAGASSAAAIRRCA